MMAHFHGGLSFGERIDGKHKSHLAPIQDFEPSCVILPMESPFSGSIHPIVSVGQRVLAGQAIGRPESPDGIWIHTGVSGTVREIAPYPTATGTPVCVTIENDGQNEQAPPLEVGSTMFDTINRAGVIGMGGAGFPTARKYQTDAAIHTVLINGCECEPYLACDCRLMWQYPERVIAGASQLAKSVGATAIVCVEDNKTDAVKRLKQETHDGNVTVRVLPTRYPQGGERQLIEAVTGYQVPRGGLPADVGVLVSNVATAAAVADAMLGKPVTHRLITVGGVELEPVNLRVPIGTPVHELINRYLPLPETVRDDAQVTVLGGPMTGLLLTDRRIPVTKTTQGLVVVSPTTRDETPCIRCGGCVRVCPASLMPFAIDDAERHGQIDRCVTLKADQCIACRCCSYICPAKRDLAIHTMAARFAVQRHVKGDHR